MKRFIKKILKDKHLNQTPSGEEPSSDKKDDKVVDADFEEVDEDKKNKKD